MGASKMNGVDALYPNSERLDIWKMVTRGMERDRFSQGVVVPAFCQDPPDAHDP